MKTPTESGAPGDCMSTVIAVANEKGGVGKTTTVVNLGAALAELNYRVLALDLDPHRGLSVSLGADGSPKGVGDLLTDGALTVSGVARPTKIPGLSLIPAGRQLADTEGRLARTANSHDVLRGKLEDCGQEYDFILLDCGPSLGLLTLNALVAADGVLAPLQSDYLALRGVGLLLDTIRAVQEQFNPGLRILGFLAAMHDRRTSHAREILQELRRTLGDQVFEPVINYTVRLKETPILGDSILAYDTRSDAAEAYRQVAREVVKRTGKGKKRKG